MKKTISMVAYQSLPSHQKMTQLLLNHFSWYVAKLIGNYLSSSGKLAMRRENIMLKTGSLTAQHCSPQKKIAEVPIKTDVIHKQTRSCELKAADGQTVTRWINRFTVNVVHIYPGVSVGRGGDDAVR